MHNKYSKNFSFEKLDNLQSKLNKLYNYKNDISTMISHRNRINLFLDILNSLNDRGMLKYTKALDVGCHSGIYSKIMSDYGFKNVQGLDISKRAIIKATEAFGMSSDSKSIKFMQTNAESITSDDKYDLILCTEVIEHTKNPVKVIKNIKALLSDDGIGVVSLPNAFSLPYSLTYIIRTLKGEKMSQEEHDHLKYPFWKSIKIFKEIGFKIIETTGTNILFGGPVFSLYRSSFFPKINKLNFYISKLWPFKYCSQFFFIIIKK